MRFIAVVLSTLLLPLINSTIAFNTTKPDRPDEGSVRSRKALALGVTLVWVGFNASTDQYRIYSWKPNVTEDSRANAIIPLTHYTTNLKRILYDYRKKRIITADWLSKVVGVIPSISRCNTQTEAIFYHLQGLYSRGKISRFIPPGDVLFKDIRNLPFTEDIDFDWITGNIYYVNFNSVYVINEELTYYVKIKSDVEYRITSIAVHPLYKLMFYSTYGELQYSQVTRPDTSTLSVCDLAGLNTKQLFKYPSINEIRGLAIDFHNDRLYWIDVSAAYSRVMSCDIDGTNHRIIHQQFNVTFQQIAVYDKTIYVVQRRNKDFRSYVWTLELEAEKLTLEARETPLYEDVVAITLQISFLNLFENISQAQSLGSCSYSSPCEQMCLPRNSSERKCVCGFGNVQNDTRCFSAITDLVAPQDNNSSSDLILFIVLLPTLVMMAGGVWIVFQHKYTRLRNSQSERRHSEASHGGRPYSVVSYGERNVRSSTRHSMAPSQSGRLSSAISHDERHSSLHAKNSNYQESCFVETEKE